MELIYKCPKCGETENLHFNYDYTKQHRPVDDVLCNECGEIFTDKVSKWDLIYEEYSNEQYPPFGGPFTNALTFFEWLKLNYGTPERIKRI